MGVADGARDNWTILKPYTQRRILDFYHAQEYIGKAGAAIFAQNRQRRDQWVDDWSRRLKHKQGAVGRLLNELESQRAQLEKNKRFLERVEELRQAIVYFTNNRNRMKYATHLKRHLPLGSGVTEAACKVVVKQRMCISGSRWKDQGAGCVLALRTLMLSTGRWQQFWNYVMKHGATAY